MASRKSVLDDGTTVLLRTSASQIADDRRYRAPSLNREPIARVVAKAHQFEILSSAGTTRKIRDLTSDLHRRASEAIAAHTPTDDVPADHPMLVLEQTLIMMVAVDEAVSALMVQRANKSKGFPAYLRPDQSATMKPALDQLAAVLTNPIVRDFLVRCAGLNEEAIDAFVGATTIPETRLFVQRFVDHAAMSSELSAADQPQPKRPRGRPRKTVEAGPPPTPVETAPADPPEAPIAAQAPAPLPREARVPKAPPPFPAVGAAATVDDLLNGF